MKSTRYITLALLVAALCGCQREAYTLLWEDNFEGETLNEAYWNIDDNARGGEALRSAHTAVYKFISFKFNHFIYLTADRWFRQCPSLC